MYKRIAKLSLIIVGIILFFQFPVFGAEVSFEEQAYTSRVGTQFVVTIHIDTQGETINAVEGAIEFSSDLFSLVEIRDANSILNFWVETPYLRNNNSIFFSGITPGGFEGDTGLLLTLVFSGLKSGNGNLSLHDLVVLRHDGLGTAVAVTDSNVSVDISDTHPAAQTQLLEDTSPPEFFIPEIVHDSSIFDGQWFLVFATQDKGSGIDHYEVKEGFFDKFRTVESPYLLKYQQLDRKIIIKAFDKRGNSRLAILPAQNQRDWSNYILLISLCLLCLFGGYVVYKKIWKKH